MSVFICASVLNLYKYPLSFSFCLNQSPTQTAVSPNTTTEKLLTTVCPIAVIWRVQNG